MTMGAGTSAPSVAAAFELSYLAARRGCGAGVPAAAGQSRPRCVHRSGRGPWRTCPVGEVRRVLGQLVSAHLVETAAGAAKPVADA